MYCQYNVLLKTCLAPVTDCANCATCILMPYAGGFQHAPSAGADKPVLRTVMYAQPSFDILSISLLEPIRVMTSEASKQYSGEGLMFMVPLSLSHIAIMFI